MRHVIALIGALLGLLAFQARGEDAAASGMAAAEHAPEEQATPMAPLMQRLARIIAPGQTLGETLALLRGHGLVTQPLSSLPPDGRDRVLVAWPEDDDCLPRAAPLQCTAVRVIFATEGASGPRARSVEIFEAIRGELTAARVRAQLEAALGPPMGEQRSMSETRARAIQLDSLYWRLRRGDSLEFALVFAREPGQETGPESHVLGLGLRRVAGPER